MIDPIRFILLIIDRLADEPTALRAFVAKIDETRDAYGGSLSRSDSVYLSASLCHMYPDLIDLARVDTESY